MTRSPCCAGRARWRSRCPVGAAGGLSRTAPSGTPSGPWPAPTARWAAIYDGHLNAVERLSVAASEPLRGRELHAVAAGEVLLGRLGSRSRRRARARPPGSTAGPTGRGARRSEDLLLGGGRPRSRAGARRGEASPGPPLLAYVDLREGVEVDRAWYRAAGMRASESHRVVFDGRAGARGAGRAGRVRARALVRPRRHPHRGQLGRHRGLRCREAALGRSPQRRATTPSRHWPRGGSPARGHDRRAACRRPPPRPRPTRRRRSSRVGPSSRADRRSPPRRCSAMARRAPRIAARSPRAPPWTARAATSGCSCTSTGWTRCWPARRRPCSRAWLSRPARLRGVLLRRLYAARRRPVGLRDEPRTSATSTTATLAALGRPAPLRPRASRSGCSIGVLHRSCWPRAATSCVAVDVSPAAVERARAPARPARHVAGRAPRAAGGHAGRALRPDRLLGGPLLLGRRAAGGRWARLQALLAPGWHPAGRALAPAHPRLPAAGRRGPRPARRGLGDLAARALGAPSRTTGWTAGIARRERRAALVVIGGGPAGLAAARGFRDAGGGGGS